MNWISALATSTAGTSAPARISRRYAALASVVLILVTRSAAAESPPPLEAYAALPAVDHMVISPSGKRIAYRLTTSEEDAIVVVDLEKKNMLGGLTVDGLSVRELCFVDDDELLIFVGRTDKEGPLKFDFSAAVHFEVSTQSQDMLLDGTRGIVPLPSNEVRIVAVTESRERVLLPAYAPLYDLYMTPRTVLFDVGLDKETEETIFYGGHIVTDWFAGSDGDVRAHVESDGEGRYRIRSVSRPEEPIFEGVIAEPNAGALGLLPDAGALAFSGRPEGSEFLVLYKMSLDDGELSQPIAKRAGASVEGVHSDINRVVYGVQYAGFTPKHEFLDPALNARVDKLVEQLGGTSVFIVGGSDQFEDILLQISGGWNSGAYLLIREGSEEPELLKVMRPDITPDHVIATRVISYQARDGLEIPALVTAASDVRTAGKAPLIVLPHDGPASYDRLEFDWMVQYFASRGYVVLQPQYRGSSGFGWSFRRAGYGEWGRKIQSDIDDGVDHLAAEGLVDPEHVCIVGAGYGGFTALAAGAFSPDRYQCVASIAGISNPKRLAVSKRHLSSYVGHMATFWQWQYGLRDFDWQTIESVSPVYFADRFEASVLLIHASNDAIVPVEQSRYMDKALSRADKDVTFLELEGVDDWKAYGHSRLAVLRALDAFVTEHLQPSSDNAVPP